MDDDLMDEIAGQSTINYSEVYKDLDKDYDWQNKKQPDVLLVEENFDAEKEFEDEYDFLFTQEDLPVEPSILAGLDNIEPDDLQEGTIIMSSTMIKENNNGTSIIGKTLAPDNATYTFCCLCGKYDFEHAGERHKFFPAFEDHRCINCNKWFFEHKHMKNPCWKPKKYL